MKALEVIDAGAVRRWARTSCAALAAAAAEIDALNVYPVPDGDTGTNLHLTMQSALAALEADDQLMGLGLTLDRLARGALLGARGNSGVIVSQLLRGLADTLGGSGTADGAALAAGLTEGAERAYAAVAEPVEGTILTVARAAAAAGSAVGGGVGLEEVARAAAHGAALALDRTPSQLAVLARAGVVDAGGRGLCVLLDALLATIAGHDLAAGQVSGFVEPARPDVSALEAARALGSTGYGYEVQFLLDGADPRGIERLRSELSELGDSLVIAGDSPTGGSAFWTVHVHVDDVGAAVEAGVRAGRPHAIAVTRFADQMSGAETSCAVAPPESEQTTLSWSGRGLVAVAPGPGLAGLFAEVGVEVVAADSDAGPTTPDILEAIRRTGAAEVVVLPNHPATTMVADAAAEQARAGGQDVAVVPTRSPVQALAAIAVADPTRRFADVVIALAEAAAATRWAEITVAEREAMTSAGRCAAGDVLGLAEGDVVLIGTDQVVVACALLDRLLATGGELVTLVLGEDAVAEFLDEVRKHLRQAHPGVDVMDYRGEHPHRPVLIGVE